jgi:4-hydroxy-3-methylbut-2-enyl diphosphate reductase IspH
MDIIDMARASGMAVILDGRIGHEEYLSVCGSLSTLQRFADAVRQTAANRKGNQKRVERPCTTHRKSHMAQAVRQDTNRPI